MKNLIFAFLFVFVASCQSQGDSPDLFSKTWSLSQMNGEALKGNYEEVPSLTFSEHDRSLSGFGGCNRLAGSFHYTSGGELGFAQTAATKMFCENSLEEQTFLQNLSLIKSFEIKDKELLMLDENKAIVLIFSQSDQ